MPYEFNGVDQGFELPDLTAINDYTITLTVTSLSDPGVNAAVIAWDDFPATPREAILYLHDRAGDESGIFASVGNTGSADFNSPNLPLSIEAKVLIRRQGANVELYVDGALKSTSVVGSGSTTMSGGRLGCHFFSGVNDEFSNVRAGLVGVHTVYFTPSQIADHASGVSPVAISPGDLLHFYPMEGDLVDTTGNGADLVPIGTPTDVLELLVEDTFNRADDADIDGSTMSDGVNTWLKQAGTFLVNLNECRNQSLNSTYECDSMAGIANSVVEWTVSASDFGPGLQSGITSRVSDLNNFYLLYTALAPMKLLAYSRVAGGYTLLKLGTTTVVPGDVIRFRCFGSSLRAYINGVLEFDLVNSDHASGKAGINSDAGQLRKLDNFRVYSFPSAPPPLTTLPPTTPAPTTPAPTTLFPIVGAFATAQFTPSSTLSQWPFVFDISLLPGWWWDEVDTNDGARGRVYTVDGVEMASDWPEFDPITRTGKVRSKWPVDVLPGGVYTVEVRPPRAALAAYAVGDTYGQHAVYRSEIKFYSPDGGRVDRTINANHGTENGGVVSGGASGLIGLATDYDGIDDFIDLGAGASLEAPNEITFMALFNVGPAGGKLIGKWDDAIGGHQYLFSLLNTGKLRSVVSSAGVRILDSSATFGAGWVHYGANWDRSASQLLNVLDGVVDANVGPWGTALPAFPAVPVYMGAGKDGAGENAYIDGLLQEVMFVAVTALGTDWVTYEELQVSDNAAFWGAWGGPPATSPPTTPAPTTLPPSYSLVDLTQTWEVPATSVVITATKVACTLHDKQRLGWAHFDVGVGNEFGGSAGGPIGTRFEFIRTSTTTWYFCGLVGFSTSRCGPLDAYQNNPTASQMFGVRILSDGNYFPNYRFGIVESDGTSHGVTTQSGTIGSGIRYYCELHLEPGLGAFGRVIFTIRTGSHAGPVVEVVTRDLSAAHAPYRFFTPWLGSADFGSGLRTLSFDIENVEIDGFVVQDSTQLDVTPYWPPEEYDDPKYTEVDGGDVVFTRTPTQLLATSQDKQDDDYVWMELGTPVEGDFFGTVLASVSSVYNYWLNGGFVALSTEPGSFDMVGSASGGYLGFGVNTDAGSSPQAYITEHDGAGGGGTTMGLIDQGASSKYWTFSLDYAGGAGQGRATLAARNGHPENVRSGDSITRDLSAQVSYTHFMVFSSHGVAGSGIRKLDVVIDFTNVSFSTSDTAPTTLAPTTPGPTTPAPPTTPPPTTPAPPFTLPPPGSVLRPNISAIYKASSNILLVRGWVENEDGDTVLAPISYDRCTLELRDEAGLLVDLAQGFSDPVGVEYVRFSLGSLRVASEHNYVLVVKVAMPGIGEVASGVFAMPTEG